MSSSHSTVVANRVVRGDGRTNGGEVDAIRRSISHAACSTRVHSTDSPVCRGHQAVSQSVSRDGSGRVVIERGNVLPSAI